MSSSRSTAGYRCISAIPQPLAARQQQNTTGVLRRYFPRRTDLGGVSQEELDAVAARLNGRPRKTLGWMTPAERFAQLVAVGCD